MPTLSDAKFDSLRAQGFTGAMSDMILQWLHAYGATSNNVNDAWKELLVSRGYDADTYQWNDAWFTILGDLGYDQKTLTDREYAFWAAGGNTGNWQFVFNGVDQYAVMPAWTPNGLPFEIKIEATPLTLPASSSRVISGAGDAFTHYYDGATTGVMRSRYIGVNGTSNVASNYAPSIGEPFQGTSVGTEDHTYTIGGSSSVDDDNAFNFNGQAITSIAANGAATATQFWHGPISALRLTDNSPIQDTYANMGDGNRYGVLEQAIVIPAGNDFEISFDWIRENQDVNGTGETYVLGGDGFNAFIKVGDTAHATFPERIQLTGGGGTAAWNSGFAGVTLGQHVAVKLSRVSGVLTYSLNGIADPAAKPFTTSMTIENIGAVNDGVAPFRGPIQNIVIKDLDNNLTWDYGLDEGSGTDIINSDASTQGNYQNLPIYDTDALMGDGARYIEIPQFTIPSTDDFDITVDCIMYGDGNARALWGDIAGGQDRFGFEDDGATGKPQRVYTLVGNAKQVWPGSLTDIAVGQHFSLRWYSDRGAGSQIIEVNGVSFGFKALAASPVNVADLYAAPASNKYTGVLQNLKLENTTTGEAIGYKINEGSGLDVIAYDIVNGEFGAPKGLGPELVANGDFSDGGNGWSESAAPPSYTDASNGYLEVNRNGGGATTAINSGALLQKGSKYRLTYDNLALTSPVGTIRLLNGSFPVDNPSSNLGVFTADFVCDADNTTISFQAANAGTARFQIDNISMKEVYDGTITPDADWQYIPEYSNNGAWTPDTDWVFIPDNSRFYPMSGGPDGGATIACRDGNNQLTPANDATIQNYTDNWERPS